MEGWWWWEEARKPPLPPLRPAGGDKGGPTEPESGWGSTREPPRRQNPSAGGAASSHARPARAPPSSRSVPYPSNFLPSGPKHPVLPDPRRPDPASASPGPARIARRAGRCPPQPPRGRSQSPPPGPLPPLSRAPRPGSRRRRGARGRSGVRGGAREPTLLASSLLRSIRARVRDSIRDIIRGGSRGARRGPRGPAWWGRGGVRPHALLSGTGSLTPLAGTQRQFLKPESPPPPARAQEGGRRSGGRAGAGAHGTPGFALGQLREGQGAGGPRTGLRSLSSCFSSGAWRRPLTPATRLLALLFQNPPVPRPTGLAGSQAFCFPPLPHGATSGSKTRWPEEDSIRPSSPGSQGPVPSWPSGPIKAVHNDRPLLRLGEGWREMGDHKAAKSWAFLRSVERIRPQKSRTGEETILPQPSTPRVPSGLHSARPPPSSAPASYWGWWRCGFATFAEG